MPRASCPRPSPRSLRRRPAYRPRPSRAREGSPERASPMTLRGLRTAVAVLGALLVSALAYRLRLAGVLRDPLAGWGGEPVAPLLVLRQLGADAALAICGAALVLAGAQAGAGLP